jgi:type IV pilus assembly protein PilN
VIRVNLLGERAPVRRRSADSAAVAIIIAMMGSLGWRHWTGGRAEARLESDIRSARSEETRIAATSTEIASLETTRAELQRQATLIEAQQSRRTIAVRIVDEVSRSLPAEAWLTRLEQDGTDLVIDGRCTSMTVLADFAGNLESAGFVKRPVAIVVSEIVDDALAASDLVRFSIKATLVAGGGRAR